MKHFLSFQALYDTPPVPSTPMGFKLLLFQKLGVEFGFTTAQES